MPLAHLGEGGGYGSDLENSPRFGIYTNENPTFDTQHNIRDQNREVHFALPLAALRILKILPDSLSTLLKPPHLIHNIIVEIKMGSSFLPFTFAPALTQGGGGLASQLLKVHPDSESTLMKTPFHFCPSPLPSPYPLQMVGEGGGEVSSLKFIQI